MKDDNDVKRSERDLEDGHHEQQSHHESPRDEQEKHQVAQQAVIKRPEMTRSGEGSRSTVTESLSWNSPGTWWLAAWLFINILLTLLNKSVFAFSEFHYPFALSAIHMGVGAILSVLCLYVFKWAPVPESLPNGLYMRILLFTTVFSLNIVLGNYTFAVASVSLREVVRSITPGLALFLSWLLLNKKYSIETILTLVPIAVGVALSSQGDLTYSNWGCFVLVVSSFFAALKGVLTTKFLVGANSLHPIYLLYLLSIPAMFQMLLVSYIRGEITAIQANIDVLLEPTTISIVLSTAFMAFILNYTNFEANKRVSALTVSVTACLKEIIIIGVSLFLFPDATLTLLNFTGVVISVIGTYLYSYSLRPAAAGGISLKRLLFKIFNPSPENIAS